MISRKTIFNYFIEERKMKLIVQEILLVSTITVLCVAGAIYVAETANLSIT